MASTRWSRFSDKIPKPWSLNNHCRFELAELLDTSINGHIPKVVTIKLILRPLGIF
jgi:hypothetical protein